MLHFQENGSTMPTAGTAPERPVHSFRRSWDLPGFIHSFRKSVMLHLSRLVYNDIQKVTAKGRLPGTLRMGFPGRAGERGLRGRSAYNESEKVVEKGRLTRHFPDGFRGQGRRERSPRQVGL